MPTLAYETSFVLFFSVNISPLSPGPRDLALLFLFLNCLELARADKPRPSKCNKLEESVLRLADIQKCLGSTVHQLHILGRLGFGARVVPFLLERYAELWSERSQPVRNPGLDLEGEQSLGSLLCSWVPLQLRSLPHLACSVGVQLLEEGRREGARASSPEWISSSNTAVTHA